MSESAREICAPEAEEGYKYWAFISYSHHDEKSSARLHRALEEYRVPKKLVGRITAYGRVPARLLPIFRDRDELAGSSNLNMRIQEALQRSRYLIVICSPHAAVSKWVNEEVKTFKALGRQDQILCLILDGEPNASEQPDSGLLECFPPGIRFGVSEKMDITNVRSEPIAADARKGKDGWTGAKLKLLAGILGVSYDELRQRERQRKRWQKIRLTAATAVFSLFVAIAYVLTADKGADIPAGESIRTVLDDFKITLFRPIHAEADIRRTASLDRSRLVETLRQQWIKGEWFAKFGEDRDQTKRGLKVWAVAQALTAIFRTSSTGLPDGKLRDFLDAFEGAFDPATVVEVKGIKYGWRPDFGGSGGSVLRPYTRAEPALWMSAALAVALRDSELLNSERRHRLQNRLAYTHDVTKMYRPLETGGWNVFPHQTKLDEHSAYVSALALLALLETRSAGLPWENSLERRDTLLRTTAKWLISQFNEKGNPPGWSISPTDPSRGILEGLTLQIYSELLRAEDEAGIAIPPPILKGMSQHLKSLAQRPFNDSNSMTTERWSRAFTNHDGRFMNENEQTSFPWHPWAIEFAVRWRFRVEKHHPLMAERVGVQRTIGHLVVDLEKEAITGALKRMFMASETLYALGIIPPP